MKRCPRAKTNFKGRCVKPSRYDVVKFIKTPNAPEQSLRYHKGDLGRIVHNDEGQVMPLRIKITKGKYKGYESFAEVSDIKIVKKRRK